MPKVSFQPQNVTVEVDPNTKLLVAATRNKISIRFGCASCRCGTCGVAVSGNGALTKMRPDEKALLERMGLETDGSVRLACQTRIESGEIAVDLAFQDTYSPDDLDSLAGE
jgi:ferredoxin